MKKQLTEKEIEAKMEAAYHDLEAQMKRKYGGEMCDEEGNVVCQEGDVEVGLCWWPWGFEVFRDGEAVEEICFLYE